MFLSDILDLVKMYEKLKYHFQHVGDKETFLKFNAFVPFRHVGISEKPLTNKGSFPTCQSEMISNMSESSKALL